MFRRSRECRPPPERAPQFDKSAKQDAQWLRLVQGELRFAQPQFAYRIASETQISGGAEWME
jgi:hypothetical protein